jgi:hypothetical protein
MIPKGFMSGEGDTSMYNPPISNPIHIHQVEDEQSDSTEIDWQSIDVETPVGNIHFKDVCRW